MRDVLFNRTCRIRRKVSFGICLGATCASSRAPTLGTQNFHTNHLYFPPLTRCRCLAIFRTLHEQKCDEIRVGDSCSTCIRLTIDCLGWGPKRPAWMRVSPLISHITHSFALEPFPNCLFGARPSFRARILAPQGANNRSLTLISSLYLSLVV